MYGNDPLEIGAGAAHTSTLLRAHLPHVDIDGVAEGRRRGLKGPVGPLHRGT